MEYVDFFDYNQITEEQSAALREAVKWLTTIEKQPHLANKLLHRFRLEQRKKIDVEQSTFYNLAKEFGLFINVQGHLETDTGYDIPHCTVCATSQDLDAFLYWAIKKRLDEMSEREKEELSGMLPPGVKDMEDIPNSILEMYQVDDSAKEMLNDINNLNK